MKINTKISQYNKNSTITSFLKRSKKNISLLLGSRVPGLVLLAFSCRGREGAGDLLQQALQVDTPVGTLHSHVFKDGAPVCQSYHGRADSCCCLELAITLFPACSRSPRCPDGVKNAQGLTLVLAPRWSSLSSCGPGRLSSWSFNKNFALDIFPLRFTRFRVQEKTES